MSMSKSLQAFLGPGHASIIFHRTDKDEICASAHSWDANENEEGMNFALEKEDVQRLQELLEDIFLSLRPAD